MAQTLITPTAWNSSLNVNSSWLSMDGQSYAVQDAGAGYSLSASNSNTLHFEVHAGDVWSAVDPSTKNRSEIAGVTQFNPGTQVNVSYSMTLEPGAANTASFLMLGQFHQANSTTATSAAPPFSIQLVGETMEVCVSYQNASGQFVSAVVWQDTGAIVRGHNYSFNITANFSDDASGRLVVVRDGQTIVNYSGPIGYTGDAAPVYWKEGIYRGASNTTIAADYSNLHITTGGAAPAAAAPPDAHFTQTLAYDSGPSASDFITNTGWTTVKGTTTKGASVSVLDGSTLLKTVTADAQGNWTSTFNLGLGEHALSATATLGSQSSSYASSQVINVLPQVSEALPVVTAISPDTGISASDKITNANALIVSGTATAASTVTVFVDGHAEGTAQTAANGTWTFDDRAHHLTDGQHVITATAGDAANVSGTSAPFKVTVDTSAPALSFNSVWAVTGGINVQGGGETTAVVSLSEAGAVKASTTVGGSTVWNATLPTQAGVHTYTVTETDVAGNTSTLPTHLIVGDGGANTLTAQSAGDYLWGGRGGDKYVLSATTAQGTTIGLFDKGHDQIVFTGFNAATAHVTQSDSTHWVVTDGVHTDTFLVGDELPAAFSGWSFT